ncbi:MAG: Holliday junction resolvase RuvX [Duodenibacillus sp.]|nr:Holliday junction resolvase RuvX [Duodenibacillus sp.]
MSDFGIVLGFDFGSVRIGVALGNALTCSARALEILPARTNDAKWGHVSRVIKEWSPDALIVGVPRHPDGTSHEVTALALKFARQLEGRFGLPVFVVDERYSSVAVQDCDGDIDDQAAAVILQQWFDEGCPRTMPQTVS